MLLLSTKINKREDEGKIARKESSTEQTDIAKRLDAVIRLLIAQLTSKEEYKMWDIYSMLKDAGLSTGDIGKIVGKPSNYISSQIILSKGSSRKRRTNN